MKARLPCKQNRLTKTAMLLTVVWLAVDGLAADIPLAEDSEGLVPGPLAGQGSVWSINSGDPVVVAHSGTGGSRGLDANGDDISIGFTDSGEAVVWTDFRMMPKAMPPGSAPEPSADTAAAFFFNSEGDVEVLNGSLWQVLDLNLDLTQMHRIILCNNYATQKWTLWLNGIKVATELNFANPVTYYGKFGALRGARLLDNLVIHRVALAEGYEAWKMGHLWPNPGTDDQLSADCDADGAANLLEYAFATDPLDALSACRAGCAVDGSGFAYRFRRNTRATDVTCQLQQSTNLTDWVDIVPDSQSTVPGGDGLTEEVSFIKQIDAADRGFFRLKVISD
jgi:hypothetical protein